MTESSQYRLSLHVSHPRLAASDISRHFILPVRYSMSIGDKRKTKTGRELGGIYSKTDISFDVSGGVILNEKISFYDFLQSSFNDLPLDAIRHLVSTGGECFYLAGIYSENNFVTYLPSCFLSIISSSSIGLKFDFYGGEN